jgi:hypothetical protein
LGNFQLNKLIQKAKYLLKIFLWVSSSVLGRPISIASPQKLTVLITYFNPVRMKWINHQIRNVLRCTFVERIIISNHNPHIHIHDKVKIKDDRLVVLNQPVQRGCGFRWHVAREFDPEYLIVIDDDFLLSSSQLTKLFNYLLLEPGIPHGLSGMLYLPNGKFEFRDKEDLQVDFLCEIYAVTKRQLSHYMEIYDQISSDAEIAKIVDATADFMMISQTGLAKPKIHNIGRLFRDETFQMEGVAVHKNQMFDEHVFQAFNVISKLDFAGRI